jgi:ferredoxin
MQVIVDLDKCQDHGQCMFAAPEVFQIDAETARLVLLTDEPDESLRDRVDEAADMCPMQAITVEG